MTFLINSCYDSSGIHFSIASRMSTIHMQKHVLCEILVNIGMCVIIEDIVVIKVCTCTNFVQYSICIFTHNGIGALFSLGVTNFKFYTKTSCKVPPTHNQLFLDQARCYPSSL